MLQNKAYVPGSRSKVPVHSSPEGKASISPMKVPAGSCSSSTIPSSFVGSASTSSARTTTTSWASSPLFVAANVMVPAGTSLAATSIDHSSSVTSTVVSADDASPTGSQWATALPEALAEPFADPDADPDPEPDPDPDDALPPR